MVMDMSFANHWANGRRADGTLAARASPETGSTCGSSAERRGQAPGRAASTRPGPPTKRVRADNPEIVFDPLFGPDSTDQAFDLARKTMRASVAEVPADEIRRADLDDLAPRLVGPHRIEPLVLRREDKALLEGDDALDVDLDPSDRARPVNAAGELTFVVPYVGTPALFNLRPTSHRGRPPRGFVWQSQGLLKYSVARGDPATVMRALHQVEAAIMRWVGWVNRDVDSFNADLQRETRAALEDRLDKIRAHDDLLVALGVPQAPREFPSALRDAGRHPGPAKRSGPPEANGGEWTTAADHGSVPGPERRRGRPPWTHELFEEHWREAVAVTPGSQTFAALAVHFRALDGSIGVSSEHLGRLCRRKDLSG